MEGIVFNVQRFCLQDGPGVRTTVFLKGCPLRCAWCHNPESHKSEAEIFFNPEKCIGCGACAAVCERHVLHAQGHSFEREGCTGCARCAEVCYAGALEICGKRMSAEEVLQTVIRDRDFYSDGGGMTLSGGEPMYQAEFSLALARGAKENGIHVCMETSGACSRQDLARIAEYVDLFLYDIKGMEEEKHRQYTGASNRQILENLKMLDAMGKAIILRCPIIPGVNLDEGHFTLVAQLVESLKNVLSVEFEPYHPLGVQKAARLGKKAAYASEEFLPRSEVEEMLSRVRQYTQKPMQVN